jgi:hypothetical protein
MQTQQNVRRSTIWTIYHEQNKIAFAITTLIFLYKSSAKWDFYNILLNINANLLYLCKIYIHGDFSLPGNQITKAASLIANKGICAKNYFLPLTKSVKNRRLYTKALQLYLEGLSYRNRTHNQVSHVTISNWVKSFNIKKPSHPTDAI